MLRGGNCSIITLFIGKHYFTCEMRQLFIKAENFAEETKSEFHNFPRVQILAILCRFTSYHTVTIILQWYQIRSLCLKQFSADTSQQVAKGNFHRSHVIIDYSYFQRR